MQGRFTRLRWTVDSRSSQSSGDLLIDLYVLLRRPASASVQHYAQCCPSKRFTHCVRQGYEQGAEQEGGRKERKGREGREEMLSKQKRKKIWWVAKK